MTAPPIPTVDIEGPTGHRVVVAPRSVDDRLGDLAAALEVADEPAARDVEVERTKRALVAKRPAERACPDHGRTLDVLGRAQQPARAPCGPSY